MIWEIVVGIETHVQLRTRSKIFSRAATAFGAAPNTQASFVDLALPGTLPTMNRAAVECAIRFGLAVNGGRSDHIARRSVFARKNYFYPDLPKGYQISQYELPVVTGGELTIVVDGMEKRVQLTRAHLEEDAGKSLHEGLRTPGVSGIDLNRAGTPLLEVVSEPDMRSAAEAVAYAKALHGLVMWIGICDGNMQEGSFRCDANVSVRRPGAPLGTRCEIKNVNSFRFLERAIQFEARRQIDILEDGGTIAQETRLYDAARDETRIMRSKEDAMDYRYFPDPDLPPLVIDDEEIERIRADLPELPSQRKQRYTGMQPTTGGPSRPPRTSASFVRESDAAVIISSKALSDLFDATIRFPGVDWQQAANWILGDVSAKLNLEQTDASAAPVDGAMLARLLLRLSDGTLSSKTAKDVFDRMWAGEHGGDPDTIIDAHGLRQVSDGDAIARLVEAAIAANPKAVEEFRAGKEKALQSLVGQIMKASQGKANPAQVNALLRQRLGA